QHLDRAEDRLPRRGPRVPRREPRQARSAVALQTRLADRPADSRAPHRHVRLSREGGDGRQARVMRALIFDCDGVLADTERYGHLPAFNATFEAFGLPVRWSEERYGELLKIGGGKERMATLFQDPELVRAAGLPTDPADQQELLAAWHKHK